MNRGFKSSTLPPAQAFDQIRIAMAGGNFEILEIDPDRILFKHGTYLTQTATLLPKKGSITIQPSDNGSVLGYNIETMGFAKYWLIVVAILFCWMIFPPILIYRALYVHPQKLMQNTLQAV